MAASAVKAFLCINTALQMATIFGLQTKMGTLSTFKKSKVYEDHFLFTHGVHEIDASAWASGMYVLELTTEGTSEKLKVIKK